MCGEHTTSRGAPQRGRAQCISLPHALTPSLFASLALSPPAPQLHIPKEGVTIAFNPSGVRCPQRGQPAAAGRPAVEVRGGWSVRCCSMAYTMRLCRTRHVLHCFESLFAPTRVAVHCAPAGGAVLGGGAAVHARACAAGAGCKAAHLHVRWLPRCPAASARGCTLRLLVCTTSVYPLSSLLTQSDPSTLPPTLQRDVEVEVSSVDRAGNFQGTLRVGKLNLGGARLPACWRAVLPT